MSSAQDKLTPLPQIKFRILNAAEHLESYNNQITPETTSKNMISVYNTPLNFNSKESIVGQINNENDINEQTNSGSNLNLMRPQSFVPEMFHSELGKF